MGNTLLSGRSDIGGETADIRGRFYKFSGQFTATVKTSLTFATDLVLEGISTDNTDVYTQRTSKLVKYSGVFTATIKNSLAVNTIDSAPEGASWDGAHLVWAGSTNDKLYRQSGFTSTVKTSLAVGAVDTVPNHVTKDTANSPWCGTTDDKLYLQSGQFDSTLKSSLGTLGDTDPRAISWNGADTMYAGNTNKKVWRRSGQFTSTIHDSRSYLTQFNTSLLGIDVDVIADRTGGGGGGTELVFAGVRYQRPNLRRDPKPRTRRVGLPPELAEPFVDPPEIGGALLGIRFHAGERIFHKPHSFKIGCPPQVPDPFSAPPEIGVMMLRMRMVRGRNLRHLPKTKRILPAPQPAEERILPELMQTRLWRPPFDGERRGRVVRIAPRLIDFARRYMDGRGKYRVYNAAAYRFYRSNSAPPAEGSTPFATSASLPSTPADTYANGTWYLSVSYFNGVIDSGFLPIGPNGETYRRLDISGGAAVSGPPQGPGDWRLEIRGGGVVRVVGIYYEEDSLRATEWAIAYTTNGADPPAGSPTVTVTMPTRGLAVLSYDLPAQAHGTTVKVRLQTRRTTSYSEASTIKSAAADATGPAAPPAGERWRGHLPEDL